jgi:Flp pilus assembly protein TadG
MIAAPTPVRSRRRAATLVEGAFVISIFLLFLFGILEYARYLMFLHVSTNAIRDAARYASVNVDKPANFPTTDFTQGSTTYASIQSYATTRLGGVQTMLDPGYTITVFPCDNAALAQTPPVVTPKTNGTGPAPAWNEASFTERICVRLQGTYRMALPSFLYASPAINVTISSIVGSEG